MTDIVPPPVPPAEGSAPPPVPPPSEGDPSFAPARGLAALPGGPRVERFRFAGSAGEYFGIWIVNLLLTIVTLGIYSAWAKVRKKRYFYGNTWLADGNFEYHGNPIAILKGRLIAFVAFVAYTLLTHFSPRSGAALLLVLMPAVPWLIVRSFAFNAVNSSYRNLRFHFDGRYREALAAIWPFILVPLINVMLPDIDRDKPKPQELGLLLIAPLVVMVFYPYMVAKVKLLQVNRTRFGTAPLRCTAGIGNFYSVYLISLLLFAGVLVVIMLVVAAVTALAMFFATRGGTPPSPGWWLWSVPFAYIAIGALMVGYSKSRIGNLVFNTTTLEGGGRFISTLKMRRLTWIYFSNLVAIFLTFGLLVPWATVRTLRYRAESLALEGDVSLDAFTGDVARRVSATGEEVGEMFDIDLSL